MFPTFLSSFFLALCDGLDYGRHVRQPFLAPLFEELMLSDNLLGQFTPKFSGGLPISVVATELISIMSVVGAPMSLALLAKLLGFHLFLG